MTAYAFVHGAGDGGWAWHLVEAELRARGHRTVAPDLPADAPEATLSDYADVVLEAARDLDDLVVVAHSFGAFTAPLVAARRPVAWLVLVAGMAPSPGEPPSQWWEATHWSDHRTSGGQAELTEEELYYADVPDDLAAEAQRRARQHPSGAAYERPWPLGAWPAVPTTAVVCTEDRVLPPTFLRRVVRERLGVEPVDLDCGHYAPLARPTELAALLT